MGQSLPISRLINVDVVLSPLAAQAQDLSTLLVLGSSTVIDVVERIRSYTTLAEVAADFGTTAPEYLAAVLWFGQSPQPDALKIGRWAEAASAGKLVCEALSAANTALAHWTGIVNGSFHVNVDGSGLQSLTALNFSAVTNLNGVASVINVALTGGTCTYNSVYNRFEFTSATTGAASNVTFLTAGTGGTDISDDLGGLSTQGGYLVAGIVAESPVACVTIMDGLQGQRWYATMFADTSPTSDQLTAVAAYIEGCDNKHIFGITTQDTAVLSSSSTTDIAYLLDALGYNRTLVQYSSSNAYVIASFLGRALTVDYNGQNTVITMMYKQEPGITAETLTTAQIDALEAKNCNVFVSYNNDTAIVEPGKMCSGNFVDEVTGTDWLAVDIMTAVYNLLYTSPTKIPQTDAGNHLIVNAIEAVCSQGVTNGLMAPGVWNSNGFGTLVSGAYLASGFYVYAPPVASQSQAGREARQSVPIQIAAKLAGAVHTVDITINVNR